MFDKLKKIFTKTEEKMPTPEEMAHIANLAQEKAAATKRNEPWVAIVNMDVDYEALNSGNFELDWNDAFITKLMKAGYVGKEDHDLVDQWFNNVCRNVVLETFEQDQADRHPIKSRKLDNNRREYN